MVSLGCDKNLCDSEAMLGLLAKHNYNITNDEQEADAIIVNTCSFIKDAMEESVNTVLEMAKLKQQNLKYLIVTGCMAQRFKDEIFDEIPEIDACLGTSSFDKILDVIEELKARDGIEDAEEISVYDDIDRLPAQCYFFYGIMIFLKFQHITMLSLSQKRILYSSSSQCFGSTSINLARTNRSF